MRVHALWMVAAGGEGRGGTAGGVAARVFAALVVDDVTVSVRNMSAIKKACFLKINKEIKRKHFKLLSCTMCTVDPCTVVLTETIVNLDIKGYPY